MEFETGRSPAIQITPRQRWSIVLSYFVIIGGLALGVNQRDSLLHQTSTYSNIEAGITAEYPARWLLDESDANIFRVRDMSHRGFNTLIEVSSLPVGADSAERNLLDRLSMQRSQVLIDYTVLGYDTYRLPDEAQAITMYYSFCISRCQSVPRRHLINRKWIGHFDCAARSSPCHIFSCRFNRISARVADFARFCRQSPILMPRQTLSIQSPVCIALALILLTNTSMAQPGVDAILERVKRATVFIYHAKTRESDITVACVSTGTLVSADGLIVTNARGVVPSRQCDGDTLIVSLNVDLNEPPIPKYRADIANADPGLDIALLRISRELDGRLVSPGELPILPFVDIGNSDDVAIDDNLLVVGYPSIGNDPVAITRGTVTAFLAEPLGGSRTWLKTRAEIPGTMAGGGAYNTSGKLIGVPTNAPLTGFGESTNCRYLDDTNRDGLVNNSDNCVPIGDFISTIRPIGLADSLIRGARLGLDVELISPASSPASSTFPPRISRLFFAPSVQGAMPATVVGSLPANARSLYLFFDYDHMTSENVYELRVTRDGIPGQGLQFAAGTLEWWRKRPVVHRRARTSMGEWRLRVFRS